MRETHDHDHDTERTCPKKDLEPEELLGVILDYAVKIAGERSLDNVLMLMADMGKRIVVSDRCTVWLLDDQKGELWSKVAHGVKELRIPLNAGLAGHAVTTGKPIFIDDAYTNAEFRDALASGALQTDKQTGYRTKALMVIPFRNGEGEVIGCYQAVNKMTESGVFSDRDMRNLSLAASYSGKSIESAMLTQEIEETQREIIFTMGEIGESRSKETGNHVKRVAEYSYLLALGLGIPQPEAEILKMASPMHDIGKVAIPDAVLKKTGQANRRRIRRHENAHRHRLQPVEKFQEAHFENGRRRSGAASREMGRNRISARSDRRKHSYLRTHHRRRGRVRRVGQRPGIQEGMGARPHFASVRGRTRQALRPPNRGRFLRAAAGDFASPRSIRGYGSRATVDVRPPHSSSEPTSVASAV